MPVSVRKPKSPLGDRKRKKASIRIIGSSILFALAAFGSIFFIRSSFFAIESLSISGVPKSDIHKYEAIALEPLQDSFLLIFSRMSSLFYPREKIISALIGSDPKVKSVAIEAKKKILSIALVLREPRGKWCGESFLVGASSECYAMDQDGILFERADTALSDSFVSYYGILPPQAKNILGAAFKSSEYFSALSSWQPLLSAQGFLGQHVIVHEGDTCELRLTAPVGSYILFNCTDDAASYEKYLAGFLQKEPAEKLLSDSEQPFRYLDLRFGRRIFLKRGGSTPIPFEVRKADENEQ